MINFKEFLIEKISSSNILYHGTSELAGLKILRDNKILPVTEFYTTFDKKVPDGVSLTRSKKTAIEFTHGSGFVFEFNRDVLRHNIRLIPHDYWAQNFETDVHSGRIDRTWVGRSGEFEEFAPGGIPNLFKYLTKFYHYGSNSIDFKQIPDKFLNKFGGKI